MNLFDTEEEAISHGEEMKKLEEELNQTINTFAEETSANLPTEEQAMKEQEELDNMVENFFKANPGAIVIEDFEAEEESEEEELTVTLDDDLEVIKEETVTTKEVEKEVLVPETVFKQSLLERELLKQIIKQRMGKMSKAYAKITQETADAFYDIPGGHTTIDNLDDVFRKRKNELSSLLLLDEIDIDKLNDAELKRRIEMDIRDFSKKLFDTVDVLSD